MMQIDGRSRSSSDFNISIENKKTFRYLNPFCTDNCINNLIDGKLQCNCADSGLYNWCWERHADTCAVLTDNDREVNFHPVYSSGTTALRGNHPFKKNLHHFWEMKMLTFLYGTDVMVGVGTSAIVLSDWHKFFSLLGSDKQSWGYSYNGTVQHDSLMRRYGSRFGIGSLIGVHLDMCVGTLEYYLNRKPLGIAFGGLKSYELYPMISSTAAQSTMKMTCAISFESSLQLNCIRLIINHPQLYEQLKNIPGLFRIYENKFFWILSKDLDGTKRKAKNGKGNTKRRKIIFPTKWPTCEPKERTIRISHFQNIDTDSESSDTKRNVGPSTSKDDC